MYTSDQALATINAFPQSGAVVTMLGSATGSYPQNLVYHKDAITFATADLLLIVNEAQDISPAVYDKNFAPMCASTNATRVFCGTVWTSHSLLSREKTAALQAEKGVDE